MFYLIDFGQVCTANSSLDRVLGEDGHSWVLNSENAIRSKGQNEYSILEHGITAIQEGDVIVRKKNKIQSTVDAAYTVVSYTGTPAITAVFCPKIRSLAT